jgi:hypothetical protein
MLPPDVKVEKQSEDATYDRNLQRQAWIRVEFYVGNNGPFVERFKKEEFSGAVRDAKLTDFANHIRT